MANFTGTVANDSYTATPAGDNALGLGGNDTLIGNSGQDTLNGNADNDMLFADSNSSTAGGNDSLFGGQGSDTLVGARFGFSGDQLLGNRGEDLMIASTNGGNTLFGGQGNDTIYGSVSNNNVMNGDLADDVLIAGLGGDRMLGGEGNDTLIGGAGSENMFGELGADQFQFFSAVPNDLSVFTGAEQVVRSRGGFGGGDTIFDFSTGDTISISQLDRDATVSVTTNSAGAAVITIAGTASDGQPANQTITVVGVTRDQLLSPGSQLVAINGSFITSLDTVNSGDTSVFTVGGGTSGGGVNGKSLVGTPVADSFSPEAGVATLANGILLQTTVNDDILTGNGGDDFMDAGAGNDRINGGDGSDTLIGNVGFDTLTGGDASVDIFRFVNFTPGEVDVVTDYRGAADDDVVEISAAGFGGTLIAGQVFANPGAGVLGVNFEHDDGAGAPASAAALGYSLGISSFYYDNLGGGLYFDRDGAGLGTDWVLFAQLSPVPAVVEGVNSSSDIRIGV
ncbi:calcium-binding protein [Pseudanabaena sp. PCC 6802]|uniref:calcium-binding protein n=1 Tax=Pseudanabaena sp. PCC 6802 TaxID=118173 RepID=UPI0003451EC0|nr:calcium-binding protein [Pseudanabaena sp. PCC 6802]